MVIAVSAAQIRAAVSASIQAGASGVSPRWPALRVKVKVARFCDHQRLRYPLPQSTAR